MRIRTKEGDRAPCRRTKVGIGRLPIRPGMKRAAWMTVALAAVLAPAGLTATASACPHADERPAKLTRAEARTAILCLVNKRRDKLGRRDLNGDPRLRRAAQRHARSMNKRNYFSHTSPSGATPYDRVSRTGYFSGASSWGVGEVIYSGARRSGTPRRAGRGWVG